MKKVSFRIRNFDKEQFLTYNIDNDASLDEEVLDFLEDEEPKGFVPIIFEEGEEFDTFSYNITDKIRMCELSEQEINAEMVLKVMRGLVLSLIDMSEYRVPLFYLVLNRNYIYINSDYEVEFICIPLEEMQDEVDVNAFLRNFVASLRFDSSENGDYVAKLLSYINNTAIFNLRNMLSLVEDLMDTMGVELPENSANDIYVDYQEVEEEDEISQTENLSEEVVTETIRAEEAEETELEEVQAEEVEEAEPEETTPEEVEETEPEEVEEAEPEETTLEEVEETEPEETTPEEAEEVELEETTLEEVEEAEAEEAIPEEVEEVELEETTLEEVAEVESEEVQAEEVEEAELEEVQAEEVEEAELEEVQAEEAEAESEEILSEKVEEEAKSIIASLKKQVAKEQRSATKDTKPVEKEVAPSIKKPSFKTKDTSGVGAVIEDDFDDFIAEMERAEKAAKREETGLKIKKNIKVNRASVAKSNYNESEEPVVEKKVEEKPEEEVVSNSILSQTIAAGVTGVLKAVTAQKVNPYLVRVNTEERIMITKQNFKVGKANMGVDYTVKGNSAVSRVHAIITNKDDVYYVKDNKSTNHTFVNGKLLEEGENQLLTHDCKIVLGDEEFVFKLR